MCIKLQCSSESDYHLLPLLVPCAADLLSPLTPSAVLGVLGAHAELVQCVSKCALNDIISNDDDGDFQTRIETVLLVGQEGAQVLVFECGEDKLNPMPVLCVARLSPTLIGGFLTAKVCT